MSLASGDSFAGYTIIRLLGSGGMGEVYLAQHPRLPRRDALKILRPEISRDPDFRQRFIREADLAAAISHPSIVTVYDRGEFEGQLWIATEYIDGADAARLIQDRYPAGMPVLDVAAIVAAVASALDHAHHSGMLHRDVKPANILCSLPGTGSGQRFALADFGIAREINDSAGMTATNLTLGTVAYAAPEQLMGDPIDGRADQYALAATAFHLLTGTVPFQSTNPVAVISQHLTSAPPKLSDRRPDLSALDGVFLVALAKNPADRYNSCGDFARDLERQANGPLLAGAPTQAAPIPLDRSALRPRQAVSQASPMAVESPIIEISQAPEGSHLNSPGRRIPWAVVAPTAVVLIAASTWGIMRLASSDSSEAIPPASSDASQSTRSPQKNTPPDTVGAAVGTQPFNASGLLGGTATPQFPDGEAGKVSVVQVGALVELGSAGQLPIAFRNNTSEGISHVDWTATARVDGSIITTGNSHGTIPANVQPGEIGLSYIYFDGDSELPPPDAEYEFTVDTAPINSPYNPLPLKVTEANQSGKSVVGAAENISDGTVRSPYSVTVFCFDGNTLMDVSSSYAKQQGDLAPTAEATFTVSLGSKACPTFAVGVSGWK